MPHSFACLHYHLIFSTKHRLPQITPDFAGRLYEYMGGIVRAENGCLLTSGGMPDHVHLLVSLPAKPSVADCLRIIKANASKWVHETFPDKHAFAWQEGYGAFSVSLSNDGNVERYIARQEEHHRRMTFQEEFLEFLKRHRVPYDEKYIWD